MSDTGCTACERPFDNYQLMRVGVDELCHECASQEAARCRDEIARLRTCTDIHGRLESELRRALVMLERLDAAIDRQNAAAIECVQEGLIDRDCSDDCPQDDTCDCKGTQLISTAINSVASNLHIGDTIRSIRAALSPAPAQPAMAAKEDVLFVTCEHGASLLHPDCSTCPEDAAPPSPAAREATKEYDRCYSDLVQTINDVQTLAYENRKLAAATHRSGKVEPTEMSAKTMNVLDNAPFTNELCPCGDAACAAVDDSANHQCGGPAEACMIPGCKECGTPAVNSSNHQKGPK